MTDERETVIGDIGSNSNRSDDDENSKKDEERMIGGGDRLPNTLTHSLTLSQTPSLIIIIILNYICNLDNHNFDDDH